MMGGSAGFQQAVGVPAYPPPSAYQNTAGVAPQAPTPLEAVMATGEAAYALLERANQLSDRIAGSIPQDPKAASMDQPMPSGILPAVVAISGLTQEVIQRAQYALDRIEAAL